MFVLSHNINNKPKGVKHRSLVSIHRASTIYTLYYSKKLKERTFGIKDGKAYKITDTAMGDGVMIYVTFYVNLVEPVQTFNNNIKSM